MSTLIWAWWVSLWVAERALGDGRASQGAVKPTGSDAESQSIVDQAQSVMQANVETPAAKLARLKQLRDKLAQVKD